MAKKLYIILHIQDNFIEKISKTFTNRVLAFNFYKKLVEEMYPNLSKQKIRELTKHENVNENQNTFSFISLN